MNVITPNAAPIVALLIALVVALVFSTLIPARDRQTRWAIFSIVAFGGFCLLWYLSFHIL